MSFYVENLSLETIKKVEAVWDSNKRLWKIPIKYQSEIIEKNDDEMYIDSSDDEDFEIPEPIRKLLEERRKKAGLHREGSSENLAERDDEEDDIVVSCKDGKCFIPPKKDGRSRLPPKKNL